MNPERDPRKPKVPGYEEVDISPSGVGIVAAMLVLGLIFCSIMAALYFQALAVWTRRAEGPVLSPLPTAARQFPPPRLQVRPPEDLAALRRREETLLTGYGWADRAQGEVRIPIDRAMDLLVKQMGEAGPQGPPGPTWEEIMQQRGLQGAGGNAERRLP